MTPDNGTRSRFNPDRFERGGAATSGGMSFQVSRSLSVLICMLGRKRVRFQQNATPGSRDVPDSPDSPPSQAASTNPTCTAAPHSCNVLTIAVIFIALYLLVRDGWVTMVISSLPSSVRPVRFSRSQQDVSSAVIAKIEEAVTRAHIPVPLRDYALAAHGGVIADELTSPIDGSNIDSSPELVLSDDTRIGRCWLFPGSRGQIGISIPDWIYPTHVSVEHIPRVVAADIGQAPRTMILWGAVEDEEGNDIHRRLEDGTSSARGRNRPPVTLEAYFFVKLAEFVYNITSSQHVQTFPVRGDLRAAGVDAGLFVLEIVDNWGSDSTCVYRVRIHGEPSYSS